jgi:hypothetical protein
MTLPFGQVGLALTVRKNSLAMCSEEEKKAKGARRKEEKKERRKEGKRGREWEKSSRLRQQNVPNFDIDVSDPFSVQLQVQC